MSRRMRALATAATAALVLGALAWAALTWGRLFYESRPYTPLEAGRFPGRWRVVDVHEHIASEHDLPRLLRAMDASRIARAVLVGSPGQTVGGGSGYEGHAENNEAVLAMARAHPGRLAAFVTIDPRDPRKLARLRGWVARGAAGLKLYSGHSRFRDLPLDDRGMMEVYAWCERESLPVTFHVNTGSYGDELRRVLDRFPRLRVNCPHFCMSTVRHRRLDEMLGRYANLYTDVSFGAEEITAEAMERLDRKHDQIRAVVLRHPDRFLFAADMVVARRPGRTVAWMRALYASYRGLLERDRYLVAPTGDEARGLALPRDVLDMIYEQNPRRFLGLDTRAAGR